MKKQGRPLKEYTPVLLNEVINNYKGLFFVNNKLFVPDRTNIVYLKIQDDLRKKKTVEIPTTAALERWVKRHDKELVKKWTIRPGFITR